MEHNLSKEEKQLLHNNDIEFEDEEVQPMISMAPPHCKHGQGFIGKSHSWLTNTPTNRNFNFCHAKMKRKHEEANAAVESDIIQVSHQKMQHAFSLLKAITNKLKLIEECENKWNHTVV